MRWKAVLELSCLLAIAALSSFAAHAQDRVSFFPDLSFWADCAEKAGPIQTKGIEVFLERNQFQVLDVIQRRNELGMAPLGDDVFIYAIDQDHRLIRFRVDSATPWTIVVTLETRPPTQRTMELETKLLSFVRETLKCSVRDIVRRENGLDARDSYDEVLNIIRKQFRWPDRTI